MMGLLFQSIGNGKSFDIIGQELTSLCDEPALIPSDSNFPNKSDKVLIEIVPVIILIFLLPGNRYVITLLQAPHLMCQRQIFYWIL